MMACGGTAIVSAVSGHEEYIVNEQNALVVPLDDHQAAVEALSRLRDDRALLSRLKAAGLSTAKSMQWDDSSAAFAEFIKSCKPCSEVTSRERAVFSAFNAVRSAVFFPAEARARFSDTFSRGEALSALNSIDIQLRTQNSKITELCERVEQLESGVVYKVVKAFRRLLGAA